MSFETPRLRMFAGPNGSGKTTLKTGLNKSANWFGLYINPDDLERIARETGVLPLDAFELHATGDELRNFFDSSNLLQASGFASAISTIGFRENAIEFRSVPVNSYFASVFSDFIRQRALAASVSFSFETVMSSKDKVNLFERAQAQGYRTYLYFVATEDPSINIERVRLRVAEGGHDVPEDKIVSRYHRSLALLPQAIRRSNRAFLFDASGRAPRYFAEVTGGLTIEVRSPDVPAWFKPIWEQF